MNALPEFLKVFQDQLIANGVILSGDEQVADIVEKAGLYYDHNASKIWMARQGGGHQALMFHHLADGLSAAGVMPNGLDKDERAGLLAAVRTNLIKDRSVDAVQDLAGYPSGLFHLHGGMRALIPSGIKVLEGVKGDPSPMLELISNLMGHDEKQKTVLLSWLKRFVVDAIACSRCGPVLANVRPSQLLILVGPPGCGKTFLLKLLGHIVNESTANPYQYFAGDTAFNGDLAAAVLMVMDDQAESVQPRHRHRLTQRIKEYLVASTQRIHPKNRQAYSVRTFQRLVILANPDSLSMMPMMDESFLDKVVLLQARGSELVAQARNDEQRDAWYKELMGSLPAFVYYLTHEFEIPSEMVDSRYGLKAYQDPWLLGEISGEDELSEILGVLEEHKSSLGSVAGKLFREPGPSKTDSEIFVWEGFARDFQAIVVHCEMGFARRFRYDNSAGMLIRDLVVAYPERVSYVGKVRGTTRWRIFLGEAPPLSPSGHIARLPLDDP